MNKKWMFVVLGYVLLLAALGVTFDGSLALIAIDRLAQSERYTDEMDKLEIYRGFEIRAFEREQGRWPCPYSTTSSTAPAASPCWPRCDAQFKSTYGRT